MVSPVEMIFTATRYLGASFSPTLGGGDYTTGMIFRPLREMTLTGMRFVSLSTPAGPGSIITWDGKLWDMDTLAQLAAGAHTTAPNENAIATITFGAPYVVGPGDVNRPFAVSFRESSGTYAQSSLLSAYTSGVVGATIVNRFLSRDIFCGLMDAYQSGDIAPSQSWGGDYAFAAEPIFTVP